MEEEGPGQWQALRISHNVKSYMWAPNTSLATAPTQSLSIGMLRKSVEGFLTKD